MKKIKLTAAEIDDGCMGAFLRYRMVPPRDARILYSYEVMGFAKVWVEAGGSTIADVRRMTNELLDLLEKSNP